MPQKFFSVLLPLLFALVCPVITYAAPNILLITCDNLGYGDLKIYNPESEIHTPRIDQLASQGARLTSFYTASPTCTVSRACLLTGRIPQRHGLINQLGGVEGNYGIGLPHKEILIPGILKRAAKPYETACFGKWNIGFAPGSRPTERGFDEFIGHASGNADYYHHNYREKHDLYQGTEELHREGEYLTDIFAEAAIDFIRRKSKEENPWFIYLPFNAPHFPTKGNKRPGQPNIYQAPDEAFTAIGLKPDETDPRKRYTAVVYALDQAVGRVLDSLEAAGVSEETFVFLMSDNGAFRLNRKGLDVGINTPLRSGGVTCWEGGLRVPAIARWPGKIDAGSVIDDPFWSPDLLIASAKLADAPLPSDRIYDGRDPLPLLTESAGSSHSGFYFEFRNHAAYRKGDWKIVRESPDKNWMLFNLKTDPAESTDLAGESQKDEELAKEFGEMQSALQNGEEEEEEELAQWIWHRDADNTGAEDDFLIAHPLDAPDPDSSVSLRITTDFSSAIVRIDDKEVASIDPYDPPLEVDLPNAGKLTITGRAVEGPSAIAAALQIKEKSGKTKRVLTGTSPGFKGSAFSSKGRITEERWAGNRLEEISPFSEYNQWKEASGSEPEDEMVSRLTTIPTGFKVECLHIASEDEGSWVNIEIDNQNRIFLAKEQKGILRITLDEETQKVAAVGLINEELQECRGLLWKDGTLFANANDSKALYSLRDTTGNDQFDEVTLLQSTEGGAGHGRNDLAGGPDGGLFVIHGDSIQVNEDTPRQTVPESGAPRELGHWIRADSRGREWRILARGLRNPYGIAFNRDGECFTYDADNEGDVGLPFYRPTRINHLVSGANYGWHQEEENSRNMTVYAPDSWPTTYDVGRGSPTAVKFGTESNFPPRYRDALFALDWAYGRIIAVHLTPRGASYQASGETFLAGRPLNVTDLDFAVDGSMLFITGGRKTKSALYRASFTGTPPADSKKTEQARLRETFSASARENRKTLETFHHPSDEAPPPIVLKSLGNPDPWIRNAARVALEFRPVETWIEHALGGKVSRANLVALLALSRKGGGEEQAKILTKLAKSKFADRSHSQQLTFLRIIEICLKGPGEIDSASRGQLDKLVAGLLPSTSEPVNKEACRSLVLLNSKKAIKTCLERFALTDNQLDALHYLEILAGIKEHWTASQRSLYFKHLGYAKYFSRGDRFMAPFFEKVEKAALSHIESDSEREAMADLLVEHKLKEPKGQPAASKAFVKNWVLSDFEEADFKADIPGEDARKGKELFTAALCSSCHVSGTIGFPSGPDLTRVGSRFSRRDLLKSILNPSDVVSEVHRNQIITRKDGTIISGRIVHDDFRKSTLSLSPNPFSPGEMVVVNKNDIASSEESPVSPMPPGLLNTLTKTEILSLLAWMEQGERN